MSSNIPQLIEISQQPIPLCQLLKIANLVSGGGEAKIVISEGYVLLNDEIEYQKRKKVYDNDIVEFNGELIQVVVNTNLVKKKNTVIKIAADEVIQPHSSTGQSNNKVNIQDNQQQQQKPEEAIKPASKRKPISF